MQTPAKKPGDVNTDSGIDICNLWKPIILESQGVHYSTFQHEFHFQAPFQIQD